MPRLEARSGGAAQVVPAPAGTDGAAAELGSVSLVQEAVEALAVVCMRSCMHGGTVIQDAGPHTHTLPPHTHTGAASGSRHAVQSGPYLQYSWLPTTGIQGTLAISGWKAFM